MKALNWQHPTLISHKHPLSPWIILANIILATFLAIISATSVGVAATTISGALIIDTALTSWIFTSYLMAVGTCLPLSGWLAERYGYKKIFFIGLLIFILGSCLGGFAFNFYSLMIFRVIEGMGAGILFPISLSIIAKEFSPKQIPLAIACYMGIGFGCGMAIGFLAGGYYGQFSHWQNLFFINVVIGALLLFMTWAFHHESEPKNLPMFDFLGYFLFVVFVVNLLLIVSSAKQPWNTMGYFSTLIITCFVLSIVSFALLMIRESRIEHPVIALKLFKIKSFVVSFVSIGILGVVLFSTIGLFPSLLENQLHYEKWKIALLMLSFGAVFGIVGPLTGMLTKVVDIRILSLIGLVLVAGSCFMNMSLTVHSDQWQFTWILVVRSIGIAVGIGPVTALGLSELPKELLGQGTSLITFARQIGGAFGASVMSLIIVDRQQFHNQMFGAQVDIYSPAFQKVVHGVAMRLKGLHGQTGAESLAKAKALVAQNIVNQSTTASMNDAYFLTGIVTAFLSLIIGITVITTLVKRHKANTLSAQKL